MTARTVRMTRGPIMALVIVVVFVAVAGYGSYRVARHLFGWSAVAPKSEAFRVEIEEATVRRVDLDDSKVELASDLLGMFGATLIVTPNTQIELAGKSAKLKDLPTGAKVRAAYEWKDGFKIARVIAVDDVPTASKSP